MKHEKKTKIENKHTLFLTTEDVIELKNTDEDVNVYWRVPETGELVEIDSVELRWTTEEIF